MIRFATYENRESIVNDSTICACGIPSIGESAAAVPTGSVINFGSTVTFRAIMVIAIGIPLRSEKPPRIAGNNKVSIREFWAVAASSGPRIIWISTSLVTYPSMTTRKITVTNLIRLRGLASEISTGGFTSCGCGL